MKKRKFEIFNIYKIAAECSINGLEFLYKDMKKSREVISEIIKNVEEIDKDYRKYFKDNNISGIFNKVNDGWFVGVETEEEYKKLLFFVIYSLDKEGSFAINKYKVVLDNDNADHYKSNELLIEIAKKLRDGDMSIKEFVKEHDDKMIEKGCYGRTIDKDRGMQAKSKSDEEKENKLKEEKRQQAAAGMATTQRERIQEEGRQTRQERKERVDREIAERERLAAEKIKKEEEALFKEVEDLRREFSQETIDTQMGVNFDPSQNANMELIRKNLNSLETNTSDPSKKEKIEELKEKVDEMEGSYIPYRQRSRPQSSGFFSSAIRRKMRLLKK